MEAISKELSSWFKERPKWLQEAARRIYNQEKISEKDLSDLTTLCNREAFEAIEDVAFNFVNNDDSTTIQGQVRLCSIGNIEGINALNPKIPLDFGKSNLAIIYGANGSGKSGYVRIIKHICGVKNPGKLHPNIFSSINGVRKCKIVYEVNGSHLENEWIVEAGPIKQLRIVDVFDSSTARFYVNGENEVTYEPPILSFFSELTRICEHVAKSIETSQEKLVSKKPHIPSEYFHTTSYKWYDNISTDTKNDEVESRCAWTSLDEESMNGLTIRLMEQNPAEKSKKLLNQKKYLDQLRYDIETRSKQISDDQCRSLLTLKNDFTQKLQAAKEVADRAFHDSKLSGIGDETWKLLWHHARRYSEGHAYKEQTFPYVGDGALCVLCQEKLSEDGKNRLLSFESYIKNEVNKDATKSETAYVSAIESIGAVPTEIDLKTRIDAAGLADEELKTEILNLYAAFRLRAAQIPQMTKVDDLPIIPDSHKLMENLATISAKMNEDALKYQRDSQSDDQEKLKAELLEWKTKKWLFQNKQAIEEEIVRLKTLSQLIAAKKLTNTANLSRKKGELAEKLITDAFVQRFNQNLSSLGASKIKVELIKTRTDKGKVLHQLKLKGAPQTSVEEILSEGEFRIVSLAAFLADVEGGSIPVPFVFDDPITSLDQDYEEAVVSLLVQTAKKRQVIVFSHRISLLNLLQDHGKKNSVEYDVICVRCEYWGSGEPGGIPIFAEKPKGALNKLINERLVQAEKALNEQGKEVYDPMAKSLCSDFRIVIERMIESELLADVVQRYRRSVNTMGKIGKLARISEDDCKLFDGMMSKYSRYEHSQPNEAPVQMPLPDEIKIDFEKLKIWHDTFSKQ